MRSVVHIGGIGLMKKMDTGRNAELMKRAKQTWRDDDGGYFCRLER